MYGVQCHSNISCQFLQKFLLLLSEIDIGFVHICQAESGLELVMKCSAELVRNNDLKLHLAGKPQL